MTEEIYVAIHTDSENGHPDAKAIYIGHNTKDMLLSIRGYLNGISYEDIDGLMTEIKSNVWNMKIDEDKKTLGYYIDFHNTLDIFKEIIKGEDE